MNAERAVHLVQVAFPQIYLACHTRHQRKRSTVHRLSPRDATILAHLDRESAMRPTDLAKHLGVSASTLSEAVKRLIALGYVTRATRSGRTAPVLLTDLGAQAISDTSVLETGLLRAAIDRLTAPERRAVARGLTLLASACRP
jgi:DNA-binding MarR family transcriptional regulator